MPKKTKSPTEPCPILLVLARVQEDEELLQAAVSQEGKFLEVDSIDGRGGLCAVVGTGAAVQDELADDAEDWRGMGIFRNMKTGVGTG